MDTGVRSQVIRLGGKYFYLLSHRTDWVQRFFSFSKLFIHFTYQPQLPLLLHPSLLSDLLTIHTSKRENRKKLFGQRDGLVLLKGSYHSEKLGLMPRTHMALPNSSRSSFALFWPLEKLHVFRTQTFMQTKYPYTQNVENIRKK